MPLPDYISQREIGKTRPSNDSISLYSTLTDATCAVSSWEPDGSSQHGGIFNFDFTADGSVLGAACERHSFLMFDPHNHRLIHTSKEAHGDCVNCIRFLDSRTFATCSDDTTIGLWDLRYMKSKVKTLHGHSNWVKDIEYSSEDGLLVTSGFDGSIYSWRINDYSDGESCPKEQLFHSNGLMRCKLAPGARKLVVATAAGYIMVVHNLNLSTIANDLRTFKPNMYRLMQKSAYPIRKAYLCNDVFCRIVNRVELISDFPSDNDCEVISALQVHPEGWCALSRSSNGSEISEWTCVHDIQCEALPDNDQSDFTVECEANALHADHSLCDNQGQLADSFPGSESERSPPLRRSASARQSSASSINGYIYATTSRNEDPSVLMARGISEMCNRGISMTLRIPHDVDRNNHRSMTVHVGQDNDGDVSFLFARTDDTTESTPNLDEPYESHDQSRDSDRQSQPENTDIEQRATQSQQRPLLECRGASASASSNANSHFQNAFDGSVSVPVVSMHGARRRDRTEFESTAVLSGRTRSPSPNCCGRKTSPPENVIIYNNRRRLTHFIDEPVAGRGFIKELCFSSDGRLIISPFAYGVRILAFNPFGDELCDCVPESAIRLYEVGTNISHSREVVSTKFSPTQFMFVSGCLNGRVSFHEPRF